MSEKTTPSSTTAVHLVGGPDDWHGQTLTHLSEQELAGDRETLVTYLVSTCVPAGHPFPAARAIYTPGQEPAPANLWFFRGWFPTCPEDPKDRRAVDHQAVDVDLSDGLPTGWRTDDGVHHRVDRILAHWETTGESDLAPDVWHLRVSGVDWALLAHPGHWEAGRLLGVEGQEHNDILG